MRDDSPRKPSRDAGRWPALALAVAVHAAFLAVLIFAVRWQNRQPEPVTAELYAPPAPAPAPAATAAPEPPTPANPEPQPEPEPKPSPPPAPRPAPPPKPAQPPAAAKPEPAAEKPDAKAAAIALKAQQEELRRKKEAAEKERLERARKDAETREAEKKKQDEQRKAAESRARQEREAQEMKLQAEREKSARAAQQQAADAAAAARGRAEADYVRKIQAKVRGNVILPPDIAGNPEAIFDVVQLPTGEIIDATLRKSSGARAYDDAVQRAILKSSPLPRPDRPDLFQRTLTLRFRPSD
jgi:colicin import membrane protein